MPFALGAGAIAELALWLATLAGVAVVGGAIILALRNASYSVGGIPVIGGSLAWLLTRVAQEIQAGINAQQYIMDQTKLYALNVWNWMVQQTVQLVDIPQWHQLTQVRIDTSAVTALAQTIWYSVIPAMLGTQTRHEQEIRAVTALAQSLFYDLLPQMRGIEAGLRTDVNAVTRLAQDLFYRELPSLHGIDAGLRTDVNAVTRLAQDIFYKELPRIRADLDTHARATDLEALRARVDDMARLLTLLLPLSILATLAPTAIRELRDTALDPCRCLDLNGVGDLQERVSALEVE